VPAAPKLMSKEDLTRLLTSAAAVDNVELKFTMSDDELRPSAHALGIDPFEARVRQLVFFDTPRLDLDRHGVALCAHRAHGTMCDPIVKVGAFDGTPVGLEVDVMRVGFACAASLSAPAELDNVRSVVAGDGHIRRLFSREQLALAEQHTGGTVDPDALSSLGPIFVLELKYAATGFARRMHAEMWLYPDGSRTLQLSTRCLSSEACDVADQARAFLGLHGVELDAAPQPNIHTALEFFSEELSVRG